MDCPAKINILEIVKFPQFSVSDNTSY